MKLYEVATRILNLSPTDKEAVAEAIKFMLNEIAYDMGEDSELEKILTKFQKKGIQGLTDYERERVHECVEYAIDNYNKKYYSDEIQMLKDLVGSIK